MLMIHCASSRLTSNSRRNVWNATLTTVESSTIIETPKMIAIITLHLYASCTQRLRQVAFQFQIRRMAIGILIATGNNAANKSSCGAFYAAEGNMSVCVNRVRRVKGGINDQKIEIR